MHTRPIATTPLIGPPRHCRWLGGSTGPGWPVRAAAAALLLWSPCIEMPRWNQAFMAAAPSSAISRTMVRTSSEENEPSASRPVKARRSESGCRVIRRAVRAKGMRIAEAMSHTAVAVNAIAEV